jgi:HD superfamily phosphohydrolase
MGLNLDATHNRLGHLLGVIDICGIMLEKCCETADAAFLPDPAQATATLIFALVHDAYHGPFGHSLDRIGDIVLANDGYSRIDKALLVQEVIRAEKGEGDLWPLILMVARWTVNDNMAKWSSLKLAKAKPVKAHHFAQSVVAFLTELVRPTKLATGKNRNKYWLRELVDSIIDADRLDYLLRDTHELRWDTKISRERIDALLKGVMVLPATVVVPAIEPGEPITRTPQTVPRLHWDVSMRRTVEDLLALRAELYMQVYEAPEKRALDEMIAHALIWMLRRELGESKQGGPSAALADTLKSLTAITDAELFHFLYELGASPEYILPIAVIHDVILGRPFREVWRCPIPIAELAGAQQSMIELAERLGAIELEARKGSGTLLGHLDLDMHELIPKLRTAITIEIAESKPDSYRKASDKLEQDFMGVVYHVEYMYGRSHARREALEKLLWERLLIANDEDNGLSKAIRSVLLEAYARDEWPCLKSSTDEVWKLIESTPLIFLSIPWVPPRLVGEQAGTDVESDVSLVNWELSDEVLWHQDGVATQLPKDVPRRTREEFYPVSVYLPPILAASPKVQELVSRLMCKLLYSFAWYHPHETLRDHFKWWEATYPEQYTYKWMRSVPAEIAELLPGHWL